MEGDTALSRWAACGGMHLTGVSDGPPLGAPAAVAAALDEWASTLSSWLTVDGAALIGERAALTGLARRGSESCGGGTRLLETSDGWVALTLSRPNDIASLEALLGAPIDGLDWDTIAECVRTCAAADLRDQAVLLEIPIGVLGERAAGELVVRDHIACRPSVSDPAGLLVVDLSSMWAGPLCGNLLMLAGAEVVKVESTQRPDGARSGPAEFFELLHSGQRSVAVDFTTDEGVAQLDTLLHRADIVIDSSRPRALRQIGVGFEQLHADGWNGVWLSITGHGIDERNAMRVGFGDDSAVAGGLVAWHDGRPVFCADAIADPATGLLATVAIRDALAEGAAGRVSVSLAGTAAYLANAVREHSVDPDVRVDVRPPCARRVTGRAPALGQHNQEVLR